MIFTFSLEQIFKTANLDANLIFRQYILDEIAKLMDIQSINQELKQSEIATELKVTSSTLQGLEKK